jgi:hypothetical protein
MFQLIKDSCETRKILKTSCHIILEKGSLPNKKFTCQKKVNNKICTACSDLYRKSFPKSDSPVNLPQHRQSPLESVGNISVRFNGWI